MSSPRSLSVLPDPQQSQGIHFRDHWIADDPQKKQEPVSKGKGKIHELKQKIFEASVVSIDPFDTDSLRNIVGVGITHQFKAFISTDYIPGVNKHAYFVINGKNYNPPVQHHTDSAEAAKTEDNRDDHDVKYKIIMTWLLKKLNRVIPNEGSGNAEEKDKLLLPLEDQVAALFKEFPDFSKEGDIISEKLGHYSLTLESFYRIIAEAYDKRELNEGFVSRTLSNIEKIQKIIFSEKRGGEIAIGICNFVNRCLGDEFYQGVPMVQALRMMTIGAFSPANNLLREQLLPDFFKEESEIITKIDSSSISRYELRFEGDEYEVIQKKALNILAKIDYNNNKIIGTIAINWKFEGKGNLCRAELRIRKITFTAETDNTTRIKVLKAMLKNIKAHSDSTGSPVTRLINTASRKLSRNKLQEKHSV